jgi:hypothetical protein
VLYDGDAILDAVGYGDFDPGEVFAGEGLPAPDPPAGSSLARVFADLDSDDNFMDFEVLALPTPGSAELLAVRRASPRVVRAVRLPKCGSRAFAREPVRGACLELRTRVPDTADIHSP